MRQAFVTNRHILKTTDQALQFGFSNVSQIISANAVSRQICFTRAIYSEIEITITFLYDKEL